MEFNLTSRERRERETVCVCLCVCDFIKGMVSLKNENVTFALFLSHCHSFTLWNTKQGILDKMFMHIFYIQLMKTTSDKIQKGHNKALK